LLTQKDGTVMQLNVSAEFSTVEAANMVVCCNDDDRNNLKDCRIVHFGSKTMALTNSVSVDRDQDHAIVSGDDFSLFLNDFKIATADSGKMVVSDNSDSFTVNLTGNAKLMLGEEMAMEANLIRYTSDDGNGSVKLELDGKGKLITSEPTFGDGRSIHSTADQIWLDGGTVKFKGNAQIIAKPAEGLEKTYQADEMHISESGEIIVIKPVQNTDNRQFKIFQLVHIKPEEVIRILEVLFDEGKRKGLRMTVEAKGNQVFVSGTPKAVEVVQKILESVDVVLEPNTKINVEGNSIKFEKTNE
jgi:hypothetical protein